MLKIWYMDCIMVSRILPTHTPTLLEKPCFTKRFFWPPLCMQCGGSGVSNRGQFYMMSVWASCGSRTKVWCWGCGKAQIMVCGYKFSDMFFEDLNKCQGGCACRPTNLYFFVFRNGAWLKVWQLVVWQGLRNPQAGLPANLGSQTSWPQLVDFVHTIAVLLQTCLSKK